MVSGDDRGDVRQVVRSMFPHMREIIDMFFEPGVRGIRCMKSQQAEGWSETMATLLGYIDMMAAPIIVLFPKEKRRNSSTWSVSSRWCGETRGCWRRCRRPAVRRASSRRRSLFPGGSEVRALAFRGRGGEILPLSGFVESSRRMRSRRARPGQHGQAPDRAVEAVLRHLLSWADRRRWPSCPRSRGDEVTDKRIWYALCHHWRRTGCAGRQRLVPGHGKRTKVQPSRVRQGTAGDGLTGLSALRRGEWSDKERARNSRAGTFHRHCAVHRPGRRLPSAT